MFTVKWSVNNDHWTDWWTLSSLVSNFGILLRWLVKVWSWYVVTIAPFLVSYFFFFFFVCSCYGTVQSLGGDAEQGVAVEAVGQGECSIYSEDTVTDETGRFRLRGLLVRLTVSYANMIDNKWNVSFLCSTYPWLHLSTSRGFCIRIVRCNSEIYTHPNAQEYLILLLEMCARARFMHKTMHTHNWSIYSPLRKYWKGRANSFVFAIYTRCLR